MMCTHCACRIIYIYIYIIYIYIYIYYYALSARAHIYALLLPRLCLRSYFQTDIRCMILLYQTLGEGRVAARVARYV